MDQHSGEPRNDLDEADEFTQAISLQAAARAARFANRPPFTDDARQRAIQEFDRQERHSRRLRRLKPMLALVIGTAVFAGIMYYTLGIVLRSPFPSASALPDRLPPQSTAASGQSQLR
jgi:hypothetical protein